MDYGRISSERSLINGNSFQVLPNRWAMRVGWALASRRERSYIFRLSFSSSESNIVSLSSVLLYVAEGLARNRFMEAALGLFECSC